MLEITKEQHNALIDKFEARAAEFGWKGKKKVEMQLNFFLGAISIIDTMNASDKSCIHPMIYFSGMRGDLIERYDLKPEPEKAIL